MAAAEAFDILISDGLVVRVPRLGYNAAECG